MRLSPLLLEAAENPALEALDVLVELAVELRRLWGSGRRDPRDGPREGSGAAGGLFRLPFWQKRLKIKPWRHAAFGFDAP